MTNASPPPVALAIVTCALTLSGCSAPWLGLAGDGGKLRIINQDNPDTMLFSRFETGIYRYEDQNEVTVLLFDGPLENPSQAVTIRMLWRPKAGATPIDPDATNSTVHYVILTGKDRDEVGIYSGAGYLYPRVKVGRPSLSASIWQANLHLDSSTDGFRDLLGQAMLKGRFSARRDDIETDTALRRLNQLIQERLGYPRLVHADTSVENAAGDGEGVISQ